MTFQILSAKFRPIQVACPFKYVRLGRYPCLGNSHVGGGKEEAFERRRTHSTFFRVFSGRIPQTRGIGGVRAPRGEWSPPHVAWLLLYTISLRWFLFRVQVVLADRNQVITHCNDSFMELTGTHNQSPPAKAPTRFRGHTYLLSPARIRCGRSHWQELPDAAGKEY